MGDHPWGDGEKELKYQKKKGRKEKRKTLNEIQIFQLLISERKVGNG